MKKITCLVFATALALNAKIINVPADAPTIQAAINTSTHGDTVVVHPGIYYENINFKGKNIVVTSRFYENNDTQYILTTVINGSQPTHPDTASCVLIVSGENSSAVLQGFTLTGGTGTRWTDEHGAGVYREGGGILITLSSPTIRHNYIINNEVNTPNNVVSMGGGGIRIGDGAAVIEHNVITLNRGLYGGGIVLNYCSGVVIRNNMIVENSVRNYVVGKLTHGGGGIWVYNKKPGSESPIIIENNTVYGNVAFDSQSGKGGGMLIYGGANAIVRNNIIWENHSIASVSPLTIEGASVTVEYNNIQGGYSGNGNINADPVFSDTSFILKPSSPCVDAGDANLQFYDPASDTNPELPAAPSWGTRRNDMGAYGGPRAGYYVPFARSSLVFPLNEVDFGYHLPEEFAVSKYLFIYNWGSKELIIDSVGFTSTTAFSTDIPSPVTIKSNSSLTAQVVWKPKENLKYVDTMLVYHNSSFVSNPERVVLRGNAIPTPLMNVNLDEHNFGTFDVNVVQKDTTLYVYNRGTGKDSILVSINPASVSPATALSVSPAAFTLMHNDSQAVTFTFRPNQIKKTFTGIYTPRILFKSLFGEDTTTKEKPMRFRLTGTLSAGRDGAVISKFSLSQNFPNPFNPVTTITFAIPTTQHVTLKVYDLLGREIQTLVNDELKAGEYTVQWDALQISSGVYIYTLHAGSFVLSKKLTVAK